MIWCLVVVLVVPSGILSQVPENYFNVSLSSSLEKFPTELPLISQVTPSNSTEVKKLMQLQEEYPKFFQKSIPSPIISSNGTKAKKLQEVPKTDSPQLTVPTKKNYIVSLKAKPIKLHLCSGTLIKPTWILTAAHCVAQETSKTFNVVPSETTNSVGVAKIVLHPLYKKYHQLNDIALVQLLKPIEGTLATLPINNLISPELILHRWSTDLEMESLKLQVIDVKSCASLLNKTELSTWLCSRKPFENYEPCKGDSGGPITYNDVIVGLLPRPEKCVDPPETMLYTKIGAYKDFITKTIGDGEKSYLNRHRFGGVSEIEENSSVGCVTVSVLVPLLPFLAFW